MSDDTIPEEGTMETPTSSDVGKQTLTKDDLGGRDVTQDEGALEEAIERGNAAVADIDEEHRAGYNPDATLVDDPTTKRVDADPNDELNPAGKERGKSDSAPGHNKPEPKNK